MLMNSLYLSHLLVAKKSVGGKWLGNQRKAYLQLNQFRELAGHLGQLLVISLRHRDDPLLRLGMRQRNLGRILLLD